MLSDGPTSAHLFNGDGGKFAEWLIQSPESHVVALFVGFVAAVIVCGAIARVMQR